MPECHRFFLAPFLLANFCMEVFCKLLMSIVQVDLPQGLCVVGDAATCFNPIYGQGMTVGIKGAILLRDTLQRRLQGRKFSSSTAPAVLSGFSKARQRTIPDVPIYVPWQFHIMSELADYHSMID